MQYFKFIYAVPINKHYTDAVLWGHQTSESYNMDTVSFR